MKLIKQEAFSLLSILLLFIVFYLPTLAGGPLNPDGGELLLTAFQGGVLHPPGFPLQSWVNLFFYHILPFDLHTNLLVGNLFFHVLNCFLLIWIFNKYSFSLVTKISLLTLYNLLPVVWTMAIQVEKYTLLLTVLMIPILLWKSWHEHHQAKMIYLFAFFWGLALGHHYLALILFPLSLQFLFSRHNKNQVKAIAFVILMITVIILYCSLFLLTREGIYPDWGKLQSFGDLLDHLARKGVSIDKKLFGFFHADNVSAFSYFFESQFAFLFVPTLLSFIGLTYLVRHKKRDIPLFGSLLFSFLVLTLFNYQPTAGNEYWPTYLRRYAIISTPFFIIILGLGLDQIKKYHFLINSLLSLSIIVGGFILKPLIDMSGPSLIDLYSNAIGRTLPHNAIYLGNSDEQILYGVKGKETRRFPIRDSQEKWYLTKIIPLIEPRLAPKDHTKTPDRIFIKPLSKMLNDINQLVATTSPTGLTGNFTRHGMIWLNQNTQDLPPASPVICEEILKLKRDINEKFHEYEWFLATKFKEALIRDCQMKHNQNDNCRFSAMTKDNFTKVCQKLR
jgi:hypothetical protein